MTLAIISAITAVFTAISKVFPILDSWLLMFFAARLKAAKADHKSSFAHALQALANGDQIPLEDAIGSDNAGKPFEDRTDVSVRLPEKLPIIFFFILFWGLSGCISRKDIQAEISKTERIPKPVCDELCERLPGICIDFTNPDGTTERRIKWGHKRVINCQRSPKNPICQGENPPLSFEEFISYCSDRSARRSSMDDAVLNSILENGTIPEGQ